MEYLKEYLSSNEEYNDVVHSIDEANIDDDVFIFDKDKTIKIIKLFKSVGINNIYGILMVNPDLFGESYKYIESKINSFKDKELLAELINEDAMNLSYINLY